MHSMPMVDQLILTMLMVLVSHMAPLANTSGPSLLVWMSGWLVIIVPASSEILVLEAGFPRLWARTTSVRQA